MIVSAVGRRDDLDGWPRLAEILLTDAAAV